MLQDEDWCAQNDLKVGDIILSMDGEPLTTRKAFQEKIAWTKPENKIDVAVWRDGEIYEKTITVKTTVSDKGLENEKDENAGKEGVYFDKIGLKLQNFVVVEVMPNSEAALKGVKVGDEIKGLNGRSLTQTDDLNLYIDESANDQKPLHFNLQDASGHPYFVELIAK